MLSFASSWRRQRCESESGTVTLNEPLAISSRGTHARHDFEPTSCQTSTSYGSVCGFKTCAPLAEQYRWMDAGSPVSSKMPSESQRIGRRAALTCSYARTNEWPSLILPSISRAASSESVPAGTLHFFCRPGGYDLTVFAFEILPSSAIARRSARKSSRRHSSAGSKCVFVWLSRSILRS